MRVYWALDKHIVWFGGCTLSSTFIDINMKQFFFIFMVITLMLPQFVSAKRGNNSSQLTVISYNMRYGTAEDGVNAWEFRKPATIKMIKKHKPDILGVQ